MAAVLGIQIKEEPPADADTDYIIFEDEEHKEQSFDIKCGEIILSKDGNFSLNCCICKNYTEDNQIVNFKEFDMFSKHIFSNHSTLYDIRFKQTSVYLKETTTEIELQTQLDSKSLSDPIATTIVHTKIEPGTGTDINIANEYYSDMNKKELAENSTKRKKRFPNKLTSKNHYIDDHDNTPDESSQEEYNGESDIASSSEFDSKAHINKKRFQCKNCSQSFAHKSSLWRHNMYLHSKKPRKKFDCKICFKVLSGKYGLVEHMKIHSGVKPHECADCPKKFSTKTALLHHRKIHISGRQYQCTKCEMKFVIFADFIEHNRTHLPRKIYECGFCDETFKDRKEYSDHKMTHAGQKIHKCEYCLKSFARSSDLQEHIRTHTGEKPYQCNFCPKSFCHQSALVRHKRCHTGEKPYPCDLCEKSFTESSNLVRHRRTHTGEKPFCCEVCGKRFSWDGEVKKHMRTHIKKAVECDECFETFKTKKYLDNHKKKKHIGTNTDLSGFLSRLAEKLLESKPKVPETVAVLEREEEEDR